MANELDGKYGAVEIPVKEQEIDGFVGEPGLRIMANYFQAFVNRYAREGRQSVAWDEENPIQYVFAHNPREHGEGSFRGTQTPALYIYRMGSKDVYDMAEDEHVMVSDIMCTYVHAPDNQDQLSVRFPFVGAIVKLVDAAIEMRRDPCFVLESDTDARKSWRGTHAWRAAGFDKVQLKEYRRSEVEVTDAESDGSWRYIAMDMIIEVTERLQQNTGDTMYDPVMGLDLKVSENVPASGDKVFPEYLRRIL